MYFFYTEKKKKKYYMEQSGRKSTLNILNICKPHEYWSRIDVLFSEKVHYAFQRKHKLS